MTRVLCVRVESEVADYIDYMAKRRKVIRQVVLRGMVVDGATRDRIAQAEYAAKKGDSWLIPDFLRRKPV